MRIATIQYTTITPFKAKKPQKIVNQMVATRGYAIDDEIYKLYSVRKKDIETIAERIGSTVEFVKERIKALNL